MTHKIMENNKMNEQPGSETKTRGSAATWLFNPFKYIAGWRALLIGLLIIVGIGLAGYASNIHFDGVLDIHIGAEAPLWFFITEGIVAWLCLSVVLAVTGLIVSPSSFRMLDLFGTQALARSPGVLVVLMMLIFPIRESIDKVTAQLTQAGGKANPTLDIATADAILFGLMMVVALTVIAWTVLLMYRAYAVSCGISGVRAIGSFIVSLITAEIISVIVLWQMASHFIDGT